MSEHLQKMGKRIDALASYKNIVLLHQSLHPGVAETRQLIEQVEQATTRIEAGLNIDLQRLRNGSDIDGTAQVSENEKQRLGRLEWMLRATLGVVVVQMMVMTVWLLR
jgi:DNA-binding ferritin-like protein